MNPTDQSGQQNPFLALLASKQGGQPPMGGGMGMAGAMMQQGQPQGQSQGQPDPNATPPSNQLGQTGDNTRPLTDALRAIHTYLAQETDRQDISMGRSIIALLSQLILRDQQQAQQKDQQAQQGTPVNATMLPQQQGQPNTPPQPGQ